MPAIRKIKAREILDSRGHPTLEVSVFTDTFLSAAAVPSGASTGKHEAKELRDGAERYFGLGVNKAIMKVEKSIFSIVKDLDCTRQHYIDQLMIKKDGTKNKSNLGANSMLAVSLACARAGAQANNVYLYEYIAQLTLDKDNVSMPRAFFNILNGGKHADSSLSIQEFMISPCIGSFKENLQAAAEIYHALKDLLHQRFGPGAINVGDEGGFAVSKIKTTIQALDLIMEAVNKAGYKNRVDLALDCAASEFYKNGRYKLDGKNLSKKQLLDYYLDLIKKYPIISIEDPFQQEDFSSYAALKEELKEKPKDNDVMVVGDDLTVTNISRINRAIKHKSCNCLLLKVNQVGTLSEALEAAKLARDNSWKIMVSHRSGETEDTFIADLAVGIGAEFIKAGAPCRGERTAKYNQLLRIEESLKEM